MKVPRCLTKTELKKQRLEQTRVKYPIKFNDEYSLLYGSSGNENKTVAKAPSIAARKSLTELDGSTKKSLEDD